MGENDNMEEKISVIIPVYNVEKYVEKSIRSVINQTYRNIEILVVDDGSTDKSSYICDQLALEYSRIKVFHKSNGGQGSARNVALDCATGEYYCFLDSDDSLQPDYIEFLYRALKKNELDISACNCDYFDEDGEFIRKRITSDKYIEMSGIEAIQSMWYQGVINIGPYVKLYKKELWNGIRFRECFSEDFATMHLVFIRANRVGYSDESKLNYLVRRNSCVRSFQEEKLIMVEIAKDNIEFAYNYPELLPAAKHKATSVYFHVLFQLPNDKKFERTKKEIQRSIMEIRREVISDKRCVKKTKYALVLSYFGFDTAKKILKIMKKRDITF